MQLSLIFPEKFHHGCHGLVTFLQKRRKDAEGMGQLWILREILQPVWCMVFCQRLGKIQSIAL